MSTLIADAPAHVAPLAACAVRTILVHVSADEVEAPRLKAAAALARKLDATLYGLAAEMIPPLGAMDPTGLLEGEWFVQMRAELERNLEHASSIFTAEAEGLKTMWAAVQGMPAETLVRAGRAADLILLGGAPSKGVSAYRHADPAEVMLVSGRPILIAPPSGVPLRGEAVVVAWKDTREARRALADALPFLQRADTVRVVEVCAANEKDDALVRTHDVAEGLKRHGVRAEARVVLAPVEVASKELQIAAEDIGADLIVAGGYGHSRLGEWVFGGVTRNLLQDRERYVLLSH
jgi:nucleotide-binding universal stress UspA family protein